MTELRTSVERRGHAIHDVAHLQLRELALQLIRRPVSQCRDDDMPAAQSLDRTSERARSSSRPRPPLRRLNIIGDRSLCAPDLAQLPRELLDRIHGHKATRRRSRA